MKEALVGKAGTIAALPVYQLALPFTHVDDTTSDQMTELAGFDLPAADVTTLQPETTLDTLETTTHTVGNPILRRVLQAQCELLDAQLTDQYRQRFSPHGRPR